MYLHAIGSCTLLCPNLADHISAYQSLGFELLTHQPLSPERALELGLTPGNYRSAHMAAGKTDPPRFELIEHTPATGVSSWYGFRLLVPALDLFIRTLSDSFQVLAHHPAQGVFGRSISVQAPAGEVIFLTERAETDAIQQITGPVCALVCSAAPALSAAFYLGLGAPESLALAVKLRSGDQLEFCPSGSKARENPSVSVVMGMYAVGLSRRGTRAQSGPARMLRGPDHELIELC